MKSLTTSFEKVYYGLNPIILNFYFKARLDLEQKRGVIPSDEEILTRNALGGGEHRL